MTARDVEDREWLSIVAHAVRHRLGRFSRISRTRGALKVGQTGTGGWSVTIGRARDLPGTLLEVWFDHWFGLDRPRVLWCGFHWRARGRYLQAFGRWDKQVRDEFQLWSSDTRAIRGVSTLKRPRRHGVPYLERFPPEYFFGQYAERDGRGGKAVVLDLVDFVQTALAPDGIELPDLVRRHRVSRVPLKSDYGDLGGYVREARRIRVRSTHRRMVRALKRLAGARYRLSMGSPGPAQYDACIHNYKGTGKDLLVEVKAIPEATAARLAVGQLLDYRRYLPNAGRVELATLFSRKPPKLVLDFLGHVKVRTAWFSGPEFHSLQGQWTL